MADITSLRFCGVKTSVLHYWTARDTAAQSFRLGDLPTLAGLERRLLATEFEDG
jgi:hypothetical protein